MKDDLTNLSPKEWVHFARAEIGLTADTKYQVPNEFINHHIDNLPVNARDEARKIWETRQDRIASDIYDELMDDYIRPVKSLLTETELNAFNETYFAVLPTCQFEGYAGYTPRGDRVVILHHAIGFTINYWSHWYSKSIDDSEDMFAPLALEKVCLYIAEVWNGHQPRNIRPDISPKTEDTWEISEVLTQSAISFIIGHELGHIVRNDKGYTENQQVNHDMEFAADQFGLSLVIRLALARITHSKADAYLTKITLFGPLFALAVISILDGGKSLTHPSVEQRMNYLLDSYKRVMEEILGQKTDLVWHDIDPELQSILENNASKLLKITPILHQAVNEFRDVLPRFNITKTPGICGFKAR